MTAWTDIEAVKAGAKSTAEKRASIKGIKNSAVLAALPSPPFSWTTKGTFYTVVMVREWSDGAPWVTVEATRFGKALKVDHGGYVFHGPSPLVRDPAGDVVLESLNNDGSLHVIKCRDDPFAALKLMVEARL